MLVRTGRIKIMTTTAEEIKIWQEVAATWENNFNELMAAFNYLKETNEKNEKTIESLLVLLKKSTEEPVTQISEVNGFPHE